MSSDNIYQTPSHLLHLIDEELRKYSYQKLPDPATENPKTLDELKELLQQIHGGVYSYDHTSWGGRVKDEISVGCRYHGSFKTEMFKLTKINKKTGKVNQCPECTNAITRLTKLREKISTIKESYGDKYQILLGIGNTKVSDSVKFYCDDHKSSKTMPLTRCMNAQPICNFCSGHEDTLDTFLRKLPETVKDVIDFSGAVYAGRDVDMNLRCKLHDEWFLRSPVRIGLDIAKARRVRGCGFCRLELRGVTFEEFLERAEGLHGDKFTYSCDGYNGIKGNKIEIECKRHKHRFYVMPRNHLRSELGGCSKCKAEYMSNLCRKPNEQFIEEANKIHNGRYDYSKTQYTTIKEKVIIICPDHGEFTQASSDHLQGNGCPTCGGYSFWGSRIDTTADAYLYLMRLKGNGEEFLKIGVSITPLIRARQIRISSNATYVVDVLSCVKGNAKECSDLEHYARSQVDKYTPKVKFGGWTECVKLEEISWLTDIFNESDDYSWMV